MLLLKTQISDADILFFRTLAFIVFLSLYFYFLSN